MSDKEEKPAAQVEKTDEKKDEEKKEKPLMMTRQTIAAANYKEDGTKLLKEGKFGKAITKYQLCRMNTQQTAIQKTKEEVTYEKRKAERDAKRAAEAAEKKEAEAERRRAAGEPELEEEDETPVAGGPMTDEQKKAQETQQMAAMMQQQMGGGGPDGMPPGMPPGMMPPGGMPGMPSGAGGMPPGMGDPMGMMGAMGGGQSNNSDDEIRLCRHLYLASLNNLAHCFMQKEEFSLCIEVATEAITFDGRCSKAYYRRGVAWTKKGNATKGSADLQKALDLNPGDAGIVEMLNWAKSMIEQEKVNEKKIMARMFT